MPNKPEILENMEDLGYSVSLIGETICYNHISEESSNQELLRNMLKELKLQKSKVMEYLLLKQEISRKIIAVDIETTGLRPLRNDIRLISWANADGAYVSENVEKVRDDLENPGMLKVFHNAMFDVPFLEMKGYKVNNYTDSMLMSQILGKKNESHSLASITERVLDIKLEKTLQHEKNWKNQLTPEHFEYSKQDAKITYEVTKKLMSKIHANNHEQELIRNEKALPFAIKAKVDGIPFDTNSWKDKLKFYYKSKESIEVEIKSELNSTINLNAPEQIKQALRNRGIILEDTKDETLALMEDRYCILGKIREYRGLQKLVSTTGTKLLEHVDPDGRIRADWKMHGTVTGRMSCSNPNIQQMDHTLRQYFKATSGHVFIDCDYSQIELRVVAEMSEDAEMITAFRNGEDLHTKTAKMIFNRNEITKTERQIAKTCNFGLIYGMTAKGLKLRLKQTCNMDITENQAELFRNRFFILYKGIKRWQARMYTKSHISTLGGKRWCGNELSSLEKFNYPVQGTAAEGLKETMALAINEIPNHWKICAIIHDEILLEVPEHEDESAKMLLEDWMLRGMSKIIRNVPIVADAVITETWKKA